MKHEIEILVRENRLNRYIARPKRAEEERREDRRDPRGGCRMEELPPPHHLPRNGPQPEKLTIHMIVGGPTEEDSNKSRRARLDSIRNWG